MPKYSTQYPKQWEAFQRCGAAKLISIEEKFDPEKAEKLFYTHLISKQKIDESLYKSNQHAKPINWVRYESKNNNNVTPYVKNLLDEDDTTTEDKMVQLDQEVDKLFRGTINVNVANRKIYLRQFCKKIKLPIFDHEIQTALLKGRKRASGAVDVYTPDSIIHAPKAKWIWEGVLMQSSTNIIASLPKCGKTTLLVQMLALWSRGVIDEFMGHKLVGECPPVIIVGNDMSHNQWCELLNKFGLAEYLGDDNWRVLDPIKYMWTRNNPLHLDEEGLPILADKVGEFKGQNPIVIVDSYAKSVPKGTSEKDEGFAEPLYEFQEVVAPCNATGLVIHHSGRADSNSAIKLARGHTSLTAAADQVVALKWLNKEQNIQDKRILLLTEGRAEEQQLVIIQEKDGFHLCGDYDQVVEEEKIRKVIDNLNDRQEMVYDLVQERSAKDLPTTYNDVAPLLKGIEDANRQARKTLNQLENHKLIFSSKEVRNQKNSCWYWVTK